MIRSFVRRLFSPAGRLFLAGLALPAAAAPAQAAGPGAPVLAQWNWWFWLGYLTNAGSRGNVLTVCIVIFCLSLFILLGATRR